MNTTVYIENPIQKALEIARRYGSIDVEHHKAWVIDQMCRALLENKYNEWVKDVRKGGAGEEIYYWEEGLAP